MAFSTKTLSLVAFASAAALGVACSDSETTGAGGAGTTSSSTTSTTTTTSTGMGGMGSGGMGSGGMAAETDCMTHCTDQIATCAGEDQYTTADPQATCEAMCSTWDQGVPGATDGNTVECRVYHADVAAMGNAAEHCIHAGPYGGNVCGPTQCEVFCAAMQLLCTGGDSQYASEADCNAACSALPDAATPFTGTAADSGATFACRGYHLTAAATEPAIHCGHAAGVGLCN